MTINQMREFAEDLRAERERSKAEDVFNAEYVRGLSRHIGILAKRIKRAEGASRVA